MITQDLYNVLFQNSRKLFIKVELLDSKNKKIGELEGVTLSGDIQIDGNSTIRRNCNISLIVDNPTLLVGSDRKIWLNKRVRILIGLKDLYIDKIIWFDKGVFIIDQPSISYDATDRSLSFNGLDLMCMFNGDRGGKLLNKIKIDANTPIHEAVKMVVMQLGNHVNVIVESSDRVVPMDIEKDIGGSLWDILNELKELYMDMEMFFDLEGNFVYQRIKNKINDSVQFDFTEQPLDLSLGYNVNYDFHNVYNQIVVVGKLLDTGVLITHTSQNTNINSPFNIYSNIGIISNSYKDDKIFNIEQARARAEYELEKSTNLKEQVTINTIPIYTLDVNRLAYINNKDIELEGKFLITSLNIPLNVEGNMSIQCSKIY